MNNKRLLLTLTLTIGFIAFFITAYFFLINQSKNTSDSLAATVTPSTTSGQEKIEVLAQNLEIPWEIIQLPGSGDLLVTERSGSLLLVKESISIPIEGVEHIGEGGLLGLTLHPNFSENNWLYLYLTNGHRNPQGLAWDDVGQLWATEHGRSGILSGFDELNMIEKGANYGWLLIQGDETREGMLSPIIHSGSQDTWAPAGAVFYNGNIFFAGLRGEALYEYNIANKTLGKHFQNQFGRLRGLLLSNNDYLYITTSNQD